MSWGKSSGQVSRYFTDIPPTEARRWRGPVLDDNSMAGIRPDGALAGDADLVITLAPDLDGNDPFVRFLVGMRNVKGLKVQAPQSLVRRLGSPRGLCTWAVSGDGQGHFVATWTEGTRTRISGLHYAGNFSPADVERLYRPQLDPADDVIDHWQTFQAHMAGGSARVRILVTSRERLIKSRWAMGCAWFPRRSDPH